VGFPVSLRHRVGDLKMNTKKPASVSEAGFL
jgi:hypothetical protein